MAVVLIISFLHIRYINYRFCNFRLALLAGQFMVWYNENAMSILVLTGPAAAGKNTISEILATHIQPCAVIDVDLVRWMHRNPLVAPWNGDEGMRQLRLGVDNACLLAKNFVDHNANVIVLDVLLNDTAELYRNLLKEYQYTVVKLMPSLLETRKRFDARKYTITEEEFKLVYSWQEQLTVFDKEIDNSDMTPEETAEKLKEILSWS
jgi:hypothetical protein